MRTLLLLIFFPVISSAQITPTLITTLATEVIETSGLMLYNDLLWTHNDAGNAAQIHQIDGNDGTVLRTVSITNAENVDWEDITTDGTYIYIGDVGNNSGDRTDLKILRFPAILLDDPGVTEVEVEVINLSYEDQTSFEPANNATNWDCEALIAKDDSLFLFTKNWVDQQCRIYAVPAEPGTHSAVFRGSHDVQGMITGASLDPNSGRVILIGYTNGLFVPFICTLSGWMNNAFFSGEVVREALTLSFVQTEGVEWNGAGEVLLSNEASPLSAARLWSLSITTSVGSIGTGDHDIQLWPNPAREHFTIKSSLPIRSMIIHDRVGREVQRSPVNYQKDIDVSALPDGLYQVVFHDDRSIHEIDLIIQH
ncbi:MAG: T9SS type A sorting domain-containing protein [Bacteroidota bacterium]|nr:T9SS type A sorting domain-containing protein [Bacteroidota bacterium]